MFRLLKIKSHFEKPSERKKREKDENTRRVKKFKKLKEAADTHAKLVATQSAKGTTSSY